MEDDILEFNWDDETQRKENLKKWAYDDSLLLFEQDEDLLFYDVSRLQLIFEFMFDETCNKREYISGIFLDYVRRAFLYRQSDEIEQIENLFIKDMASYYASTNDLIIGQCVDYFFACKNILVNPPKASWEQIRHVGKLLLNGLTCHAKLTEPVLTSKGNYRISTHTSVDCYIVIDSQTGHYKFSDYPST